LAVVVPFALVSASPGGDQNRPQSDTPCLPAFMTAVVSALQQPAPATCSITRPPNPPFVPPKACKCTTGPNSFWYGSGKLWTLLGASGVWGWAQHHPGYADDPLLTAKIPWWTSDLSGLNWSSSPWKGSAAIAKAFKMSGKRLDGDAAPIEISGGSASYTADWGPFLMTGVFLPTPGCWEITGEYLGDKVSFVVWSAPLKR